jgi:hypothetical protein
MMVSMKLLRINKILCYWMQGNEILSYCHGMKEILSYWMQGNENIINNKGWHKPLYIYLFPILTYIIPSYSKNCAENTIPKNRILHAKSICLDSTWNRKNSRSL